MKILTYTLFVALLVACSSSVPDEPTATQRYRNAIIDASRELTEDDIYNGLVSLRYGESPLVEWRVDGGDTLILVSTLQGQDWNYSNLECGESATTSADPNEMLWVTIPRQLNERLLSGDNYADSLSLNTRLLELIGLRPDGDEAVVNLMWVNKDDLLRPSYDPTTTTTHGAIDYPSTNIPEWYEEWFEGNIDYSYFSPSEGLNYPFTRLGYTYDWGEGESRYGLSEFVVAPSSVVTLERSCGCWSYYNQQILVVR